MSTDYFGLSVSLCGGRKVSKKVYEKYFSEMLQKFSKKNIKTDGFLCTFFRKKLCKLENL